MRLPAEFIRLPFRVDAARIAAELATVDPSAWRPHPQGNPGNWALPLVASGGDPTDDGVDGPMRPTPHLDAMPYTRQVLAALGTPIGRTRFMRLDAEAEATTHVDVNHYWVDRVRLHLPVQTRPSVTFHCGERTAHMAAGEAWIFDTWRPHNVVNPDGEDRIHLVVDTLGSDSFWTLIAGGEVNPDGPGRAPLLAPADTPISFEPSVPRGVLPAAELDRLLDHVIDGVTGEVDDLLTLHATLDALRTGWRRTLQDGGDEPHARPFAPLLAAAARDLAPLVGRLRLPNGQDAVTTLGPAAFRVALRLAPTDPLERPIFIISAPRSGSTLLFETLAQSPGVATIGGESHALIEGIPGLHPADHDWASNRLTAADATPDVVAELRRRFTEALRDRDGSPVRAGVTLLEKTPKNALRIPFLAAAFPEARFVYLYRDPVDTLASSVEAWRSGRFATYPELPGWDGPPWSLLLVPGWQELAGLPVAELAARQWSAAVGTIVDDLTALPADRWCVVSYGQLVADPQAEVGRLCEFLGLPWDRALPDQLPPSATTLTPPAPGKWRTLAHELAPLLPVVAGASARARDLFAETPGPDRATQALQETSTREPFTPAEVEAGFSSQSTSSFAALLEQAASLASSEEIGNGY